MTEAQVIRREWRAPSTNRAAIIEPAWSGLPQVVDRNRSWFAAHPLSATIDWEAWRRETRRDVLAAAVAYTTDIAGAAPTFVPDGPLIVDGHQPELFHPGVWAKNFAIHRLAERCRGTSLHLIVDNDVLKRTAIRVPAGSVTSPQFAWEAFDQLPSPLPWEEARITDPVLFESFGERVVRRLEPWGVAPLAAAAWPAALAQQSRSLSLVDALTAARVAVESAWDVTNLELPVSRLSATPSFQRFAALLMCRAGDVVRHYNDVVHEYRRANHIRSRSHPVPDLAVDGDWHEVPFRVWRAGDVRRQRPYVRRIGEECELRDERDVLARWACPEAAAVAITSALSAHGIRLRPRALTLTLFARLLLADLFVHGLGGAKYDEMTDALTVRLFGAPPPPFLTVSATVWLPLGDSGPTVTASEIGQLREKLWALAHNPQRFIAAPHPLAKEKADLLAAERPAERAERRQRYLRMREINTELAPMLAPQREQLLQALAAREHVRDAQRVLQNREWSWVLFPEDALRGFYDATFPAEG
jgi:hypothetical protein